MQTFLAYADYAASAKVLDDKRLGNQFYNEGICLIKDKWPNHPASRMWRGHKYHLGLYLQACHTELVRRGRSYPKWMLFVADIMAGETDRYAPPWLGNEAVHASHRSNLLRKDSFWYSDFGWKEPNNLPYIWPLGRGM